MQYGLLAEDVGMSEDDCLKSKIFKAHFYQKGVALRFGFAIHCPLNRLDDAVPINHLPGARGAGSFTILSGQHFFVGENGLKSLFLDVRLSSQAISA